MFPVTHKPVRFSGDLLTYVSERHLLKDRDMKELSRLDTDARIGRIPAELRQALLLSEDEVFQQLDFLADVQNKKVCDLVLHRPYYLDDYKGTGLILNKLHPHRNFGAVYFFKAGEKDYVLKIHNSSYNLQEAAVGSYFTHQPTSDMCKLIAANVDKRWQLMECIDHTTPMEGRSGKTLKEQGYEFTDDGFNSTSSNPYHLANRINGIRIDYGQGDWVKPQTDYDTGYIQVLKDYANHGKLIKKRIKRTLDHYIKQLEGPMVRAKRNPVYPTQPQRQIMLTC